MKCVFYFSVTEFVSNTFYFILHLKKIMTSLFCLSLMLCYVKKLFFKENKCFKYEKAIPLNSETRHQKCRSESRLGSLINLEV